MKKIITTIFGILAFSLGIKADVVVPETTDSYTIEEATIEPGAEFKTIEIGINAETLYTACQMKIVIPEGYSYYYDEDAEDYAAGGSMFSKKHALTCNIDPDDSQILIVSISSSNNSNFKSKTGTVMEFYVKANSWVKPGSVPITLTTIKFIQSDGTQFTHANQTISDKVTASTSCTLPINVTAADKWGTITSPFEITSIPAGLTAYTISSIEGENVNLSKATKIEAFKPYVLEASADVNTTLNGTVDAKAYATAVTSGLAASSNATAVYSAQNITSGYVLQNQGSEAMFYQLPSEGLKIPAGKVVVTGTSGAKALNFVVEEDEATVINKIENASNSDAIYDIQGRRVATPKHGIYIKGGKKIAM